MCDVGIVSVSLACIARTVNGSTYIGMAEEKEKATQDFEQRQNAGENVGLVESR